MKAIVFALLAAFFFGVVAPFVRTGINKGMHPDGYLIPYGIALLVISLPTLWEKGVSGVFPNKTALVCGIAGGVLCTIASRFSVTSLAIQTTVASVVILITGIYPVIASGICIPLFKEMDRLNTPKFVFGMLFTVAGVCLVSTSVKQPPKEIVAPIEQAETKI